MRRLAAPTDNENYVLVTSAEVWTLFIPIPIRVAVQPPPWVRCHDGFPSLATVFIATHSEPCRNRQLAKGLTPWPRFSLEPFMIR